MIDRDVLAFREEGIGLSEEDILIERAERALNPPLSFQDQQVASIGDHILLSIKTQVKQYFAEEYIQLCLVVDEEVKEIQSD